MEFEENQQQQQQEQESDNSSASSSTASETDDGECKIIIQKRELLLFHPLVITSVKIKEIENLPVPYKHSRAISFPTGSAERAQSYGDGCFVSASSYMELSPSPATSFFASLAEKTLPCEIFRLQPKDIVGNYVLIKKVSYGTFSECWHAKAIDINDYTDYAIKVLLHGKDWRNELKYWKKLNHPNILQLIDYFELGNLKFAVSLLASRGTLLKVVKEGNLTLERIRGIFEQLAKVISYLHSLRFFHKDLKLENILLHEQDRVLLCDFGFCVHIPEYSQKYPNDPKLYPCHDDDDPLEEIFSLKEFDICCGSINYCPPEMLDEENYYKSHRKIIENTTELFDRLCKADCWALGVILYCMIKGEFPFSDEFTPRLKQIIMLCLYKETGVELVDDLLQNLLQKNYDLRYSCDQILLHPWVITANVALTI